MEISKNIMNTVNGTLHRRTDSVIVTGEKYEETDIVFMYDGNAYGLRS